MINFNSVDFKFWGIYRAQVLDNNDPSKLGRIKINVFTIFDGVDAEDLPWATPASSISSGAGSGYGNFAVPEIGSYVWCFFEAGDFNQPVYFAGAPDAVHGLPSERTTNYPYRKVLKTKNGIVIYIDDSNGDMKVINSSGAYIRIKDDGNIIISGSRIDLNP